MSIRLSKYIDGIRGLQFFQLIRYGIQLLIAILLVKFNFSQAEIGQYETFLLISGFFSFFWVSGLINALLSLYKEKTGKEQQALIFNLFLLLTLINTLVVAILYIFSGKLNAFTEGTETSGYLNYILIFILLNNPAFIVEYIYLLNNKSAHIVRYAIIIFSILFICIGVPIIFQMGMTGVFQGMVAFAAMKFLWLLIVLRQYAKPIFQTGLIKEVLVIGIPIIASIFLSGSAEYVDGWIIKYFTDDASFSVFRYGARELPFVVLLANAFSVATIPLVSQGLKDGLSSIRKKSARMMHWMFPTTLFLLFISEWLFINLFNAEFRESAMIFNVYLLLIVPRLVFPQTVLTGMKKTSWLTLSSLVELIINVSLSIYFLHLFGLVGVAYATFIAFLIDKLFLISVTYFSFKIKPSSYIPLKIYLPYLLLTLVIFCYLHI